MFVSRSSAEGGRITARKGVKGRGQSRSDENENARLAASAKGARHRRRLRSRLGAMAAPGRGESSRRRKRGVRFAGVEAHLYRHSRVAAAGEAGCVIGGGREGQRPRRHSSVGWRIESVARGRTRRGTHSVDEADGVAAVLRDEVAAAAEASEHARVAPSRARCASLCATKPRSLRRRAKGGTRHVSTRLS